MTGQCTHKFKQSKHRVHSSKQTMAFSSAVHLTKVAVHLIGISACGRVETRHGNSAIGEVLVFGVLAEV